MSANILPAATQLDYVSIAAAREMSGLRLVLGQYTIPGPWREACKGLFHVKGIAYTRVVTADAGKSDLAIGMDGSQTELIAWTGQPSAPVAVWNDERPRSSWIDQLNLAERLNPEPPLLPSTISDRIVMFGLINELAGENGIAWQKRLLMVHGPLSSAPWRTVDALRWSSIFLWQERHRAEPSFASMNGWSELCGSWHFRQFRTAGLCTRPLLSAAFLSA